MKRVSILSALMLSVGLFSSAAVGYTAEPTPGTPSVKKPVVVTQSDTQLVPEKASTPTSKPAPRPPTSTLYPEVIYSQKEERQIGEYSIRLWANAAADAMDFQDVVTISQPGQSDIQVESVFKLNDLTATDITGAGYPDLVIQTFSGGAHCCFSWTVYELGPALKRVLQSPDSNCEGELKDLDGDGTMEFITCDDLFAYKYCCFANSPLVKVVMKYELERGYVPASPQFPKEYADDIVRDRQMAIGARAKEKCEWDNSTKCSVLPVALDYLYSGQQDKAWIELHRLYRFQDEDTFRQEILDMVSASPLFVSQ
jgi:hypothetical protein